MVDVVTARATGMRTMVWRCRGGGRRVVAGNQQVGEREVGVAPGILDRHPLVPAVVLDREVARVAGDGAIGRRDLDLGERIVAGAIAGFRAGVGRRIAAGGAVAATAERSAGDRRGARASSDRARARPMSRVPHGDETSGHRRYHVTQSAVPPGLPP